MLTERARVLLLFARVVKNDKMLFILLLNLSKSSFAEIKKEKVFYMAFVFIYNAYICPSALNLVELRIEVERNG